MAKNKMKKAKAVKQETEQSVQEKDPRIKDKKATILGSERLVNNVTKENMIIYFLTAICPPLGLYMLWGRPNTIPYTGKFLWTMIAIVVVYAWILMLTGNTLPTSY